jgi:hypothetical protein
MPTNHEIEAAHSANEWLATLPLNVRANTVATEVLQQHWITNSPRQMAETLADCIKQKAWEGIAYMPSIPSKRQVRSYAPLEWLRECIGAEPDELMRVLAGQQLTKEDTEPAAAGLVSLMSESEPETLRDLCEDVQVGESTMVGWLGLIKQCNWGTALQALTNSVKNEPGAPEGNTNNNKVKAAHRAGSTSDPTLGASSKPTDRKSRVIRTLQKLKADPEACKAKGTDTEKVSGALSRLVRGLTPSVEAAKREAGIATKKKVNAGLGIRGPAPDVAKRVIRDVGKAAAKEIALAILAQLDQ